MNAGPLGWVVDSTFRWVSSLRLLQPIFRHLSFTESSCDGQVCYWALAFFYASEIRQTGIFLSGS
jgi:hypothetical protein